MRRIEIEYHRKRSLESVNVDDLRQVEHLLAEAEKCFAKARELAKTSEYSYVSHIQMLVRAVEFGRTISGKGTYAEFLTDPNNVQYQEMVERAEMLLRRVKRLSAGRQPSNYVAWAETDLTKFYGDYGLILQRWNSLLNRRGIYAPSVRRRLVYAYLARRDREWDNLPPDELRRVAQLMEENVLAEPDNESNIRMWFQAASRLPTTSLEVAINRLANWRTLSDTLDAIYYMYVLHALKAIDGSDVARRDAERLIKECQHEGRLLPNGTFSFQWLGRGPEITRLVHFSRLGEFDEDGSGFYKNEQLLTRVRGKIAEINNPGSGQIELMCGLKAFFVPSQRRRSGSQTFTSQDLNQEVDFYLGFSYEGLRAWNVQFAVTIPFNISDKRV
jgi:hypothetical protein